MTEATAPGKVILFGEHSVVYGQPAVAIPVSQVRARATVHDAVDGSTLTLPDLGEQYSISAQPDKTDKQTPLAEAIRQAQAFLKLDQLPPLAIELTSTIPIASGMGSGAAAAAAIIRAILKHFRAMVSPDTIANLTFNVEKVFHGTPGGVDNTVVSFEQPVYFIRQQPKNTIETVQVGQPIELLIANTGISSPTKLAVADVRRQRDENPAKFNRLFEECGRTANLGRAALQAGDVTRLGELMLETHQLLQEMTVSSAELDRLVQAAMDAGAIGAKLSGGGRGGNMIVLISAEKRPQITNALLQSGATSVLHTTLS